MTDDPRVDLLRQLADPVRLGVVDRLGHGGPSTPSRLAAELGVAAPQLSNHLRRLRTAGLVTSERRGRQVVYALADGGLERMLPLLDRLTGRLAPAAPTALPSRTCYDHLAGPLGVALYDALLARGAVREHDDGTAEPGPHPEALEALGVDPAAVDPGRRRLAYACLDATERRPHLAGALGDALAEALLACGWIAREPGGRTVAITPAGRAGLRAALGLETT
jgi:DNA-binding transcriptional ArsR family regulator